jgi:hypothetical protein
MQWKTSCVKFGGSTYMLVPPELVAYLALEIGAENIVLEEKEKTKGRFGVFWKNVRTPEEQKKVDDAKAML